MTVQTKTVKAKEVKPGDVLVEDGIKHKVTENSVTRGFRMAYPGERHAYARMIVFGRDHILKHPESPVEIAT